MDKEYLEIVGEEEAFLIQGGDSSLQHMVYLLRDTNQQASLFYAPIVTPVCIDGKCKPVHISLYWNLIGNYVGYALPPTIPLSKYDHESFEEGDYLRLHQLLMDDKSVLKRKTLDDLFDKNANPEKKVRYKGEEIDGVTGATRKEIKESLVAGALYSCYTIWHLAHGEVKDQIESYAKAQGKELLETALLYSPYRDYQHFAIRGLDSLDLLKNMKRITSILPTTAPLTRSYLLKKLPKGAFADPRYATLLYNTLPDLDLNAKTLLIRRLSYASDQGIETCFRHLSVLSKNQIKYCLKFLEQHPDKKTDRVQALLGILSENEDFSYSYLVKAFLDK
ncbi:MAG: hypothetical protein KTR30_37530 [Saprospiraceae bacterium]|nr:hypothetical protein [Saprospiraceae bacterium]